MKKSRKDDKRYYDEYLNDRDPGHIYTMKEIIGFYGIDRLSDHMKKTKMPFMKN